MRSRILLAATAVAGVSVGLAMGIAPAIGKSGRSRQATTQTVSLSCTFNLTTQPQPGSSSATPDDTSGLQFGRTTCTPKPTTAPPAAFGKGVIFDAFAIAETGDTTGSYNEYFLTGALRGAFDLTSEEGTGGFQSAVLTGTATITQGTGAYRGVKAKRPAAINCTTNDSVQYACTETVTLTMPVKAH